MKDQAALRPTVLVVTPDASERARMEAVCGAHFECLTAANGAEALTHLQEHFVEVVLCATGEDAPEGVALLEEISRHWPETVRIAQDPLGMAQKVPEDVYQVITTDMGADPLLRMLRNATQLFQVRRDNDRMSFEMRFLAQRPAAPPPGPRDPAEEGLGFEALIRTSASPLNAVVASARHLASFDVPILITGAVGTGKALLARAIHDGSLRADRPFHGLNCAGLTDAQLRLELIGLRQNGQSRIGLLQKTERGTLFLNGIDTLPTETQHWLARALIERQMDVPGQSDPVRLDVRVIGGAHADLRPAIAEDRFSPRLYHAVALGQLALPALAERPTDIPALAHHILFEAATRHGKSVRGIDDDAMAFLVAYDWPGNQPELENEIGRMLIFAQTRSLGPELNSRHILQAEGGHTDPVTDAVIAGDGPLKCRVEEVEKRILREVLTRLKWNKSRAANELGLSRVGLRAKLDRYGLTPGVVDAPQGE